MRKMPHGQWVAFEGFDNQHKCQQPPANPPPLWVGSGRQRPTAPPRTTSEPSFADIEVPSNIDFGEPAAMIAPPQRPPARRRAQLSPSSRRSTPRPTPLAGPPPPTSSETAMTTGQKWVVAIVIVVAIIVAYNLWLRPRARSHFEERHQVAALVATRDVPRATGDYFGRNQPEDLLQHRTQLSNNELLSGDRDELFAGRDPQEAITGLVFRDLLLIEIDETERVSVPECDLNQPARVERSHITDGDPHSAFGLGLVLRCRRVESRLQDLGEFAHGDLWRIGAEEESGTDALAVTPIVLQLFKFLRRKGVADERVELGASRGRDAPSGRILG